jgi:hypothetical protein
MIEIKQDQLVFNFPEVHPEARLTVTFMRTLRIPDDGKDYPLPAGLGRFPLRHVDDFSENLPTVWRERGGVMFPMYQSEALWLDFNSYYPFALKVAAGKINAVSGEAWSSGLNREPQDYVTIPSQPWLDGYAVEKGIIRQFVAEPLGLGYTAEEQITGKAEFGGLQFAAFPMKRSAFEHYFPPAPPSAPHFSMRDIPCAEPCPSMGLAPGGRMRQEIMEDAYKLDDWDTENTSRCFVHLCNSMVWRQITGSEPPTVPPTAKEYAKTGMPWFEYYDDACKPLPGSATLAKLKSVGELNQSGSKHPQA